jgi:hypothetical protein
MKTITLNTLGTNPVIGFGYTSSCPDWPNVLLFIQITWLIVDEFCILVLIFLHFGESPPSLFCLIITK